MRARAVNAGGGERRRRARDSRAALAERIEGRRAELEAAILTRIRSDGAPVDATDPAYGEGLRAAVPIALDYCLEAIERPEANPPPIPTALRAQARTAARNAVALEVVLRRYFAGYTLLGDLLIEETEATGPRRSAELQGLLRLLAASFERLLAAVGEEYRREAEAPAPSAERRRAELIERLLAGEPLEGKELDYDVSAHHLGVVAKGLGAAEAVRELATAADRRLLLLEREDGTVWGWLGGRASVDLDALCLHAESVIGPQTALALGESAEGASGWRLSHRQALAALPVALRSSDCIARYVEVALLAAALRDDLLGSSLRQLLEPLKPDSCDGEVLCQTLRAYLQAERNVSSAAAALGVNRNTVANRLRSIELRLGQSLGRRAAELETALRLEKL